MLYTAAEVMSETWNYHGGWTSTAYGMNRIYKSGKKAKEEISKRFLDGKQKKTFTVSMNPEENLLDNSDAIIAVKEFATAKALDPNKKTNLWRVLAYLVNDDFINHVFTNTKIDYGSNTDVSISLCDFLAAAIFDDAVSSNSRRFTDLFNSVKEIDCQTPKLSKQIVKIHKALEGKKCGFTVEKRDEILSILSVVQSFKPVAKNEVKIVLSVDPIDFITASLNDYNWSSCNTPDGCYATMPLSLYLDSSTVVAYIESEKSQYVAFHPSDTDQPYTCSNKKIRRYIHFNVDYTGATLNATYPNRNISFDKACVGLFKSFQFSKVEEETCTQSLKQSRVQSDAVYRDLGRESIVLLHNPDEIANTLIGEEVPCVMCGRVISDQYFEAEDDDARRGLCYDCADNEGYLNCDED